MEDKRDMSSKGNRTVRFIFALIALCAAGFGSACAIQPVAGNAEARHVVLMIGDGMGFEHVKASSIYLNGRPGTLSFESFPFSGEITTQSANNGVTDSAASATAMATGVKVDNGVVSMAVPGEGGELVTLLEYFKNKGMATGVVTTTFMTHATPAAFGAHEASRNSYMQIADDYLNQTRPNVLFGGGGYGMSVAAAEKAGYIVVTNAAEMEALDADGEDFVSGQFGVTYLPYELDGLGDLPHLSEMTATALNVLDNDPDGFFLVVEGGRIDHASHDKDIARTIHETIAFDQAVQVVMEWAQGRTDTQVIVTADHETGGLTVESNNGAGTYPTVTWSMGSHTGVNVPIYAWGVHAGRISGVMDNTGIFGMIARERKTVSATGR